MTAVHKAPGDYPGGKEGDVLTVEFSRPGRSLFWSQRRSGVQAQRSLFVPDCDGQSGRDPEAAGLTRLTIRQPLEAERGLSASFDLSRTDGPLSYTATLFTSRIAAPIHVERSRRTFCGAYPTQRRMWVLNFWARCVDSRSP